MKLWQEDKSDKRWTVSLMLREKFVLLRSEGGIKVRLGSNTIWPDRIHDTATHQTSMECCYSVFYQGLGGPTFLTLSWMCESIIVLNVRSSVDIVSRCPEYYCNVYTQLLSSSLQSIIASLLQVSGRVGHCLLSQLLSLTRPKLRSTQHTLQVRGRTSKDRENYWNFYRLQTSRTYTRKFTMDAIRYF